MRFLLIYIFVIVIFLNNVTFAQNLNAKSRARNLVFVEAGGFGGYGSVNYEYLLKRINNLKLSARLGFSTYHLNDYTNSFNPDIIIPMAVNAYYGNKHNIDFSLGQTITSIIYADNVNYKPIRKSNFNLNFSLGYRYQKEEAGIMFKIAYAPILEKNNMFRNWFLLDLGYSF